MKEYVNTFLHYRFLLGELVKKGIKLNYNCKKCLQYGNVML